jgi:hypothetical protein
MFKIIYLGFLYKICQISLITEFTIILINQHVWNYVFKIFIQNLTNLSNNKV